LERKWRGNVKLYIQSSGTNVTDRKKITKDLVYDGLRWCNKSKSKRPAGRGLVGN
jgi:hypothetical protein